MAFGIGARVQAEGSPLDAQKDLMVPGGGLPEERQGPGGRIRAPRHLLQAGHPPRKRRRTPTSITPGTSGGTYPPRPA
jgi:hypothetical protein